MIRQCTPVNKAEIGQLGALYLHLLPIIREANVFAVKEDDLDWQQDKFSLQKASMFNFTVGEGEGGELRVMMPLQPFNRARAKKKKKHFAVSPNAVRSMYFIHTLQILKICFICDSVLYLLRCMLCLFLLLCNVTRCHFRSSRSPLSCYNPPFFSRATLPDLPHPPAHLFTTIYNGSFPLVASARLCSLLFFFCPSSPAFAAPAWKLLRLHFVHSVPLCTCRGNGLSVLSAVKLQNGFTATVPGAHLFTTNKSRPNPVVRRRNCISLASAWLAGTLCDRRIYLPCHTKLNELMFCLEFDGEADGCRGSCNHLNQQTGSPFCRSYRLLEEVFFVCFQPCEG